VPVPLIPGAFEQLSRRTFSFYPAIVGIERNEWALRRLTWSEMEVANTKTSEEVLIPRRFLGEVSSIEEPFLIVGLVKELEYKAGVVVPHRRRVIEMPRAVNGMPAFAPPAFASPGGPAPVIAIRVEVGVQSRTGKRLRTWIVAGILACITAAQALIVLGGHRKSPRENNRHTGSTQRAPVPGIGSFR